MCGALAFAVAAMSASGASAGSDHPLAAAAAHGLRVTTTVPESGRVGGTVEISGRVTGGPAGSRVALERRSSGGRWSVLALAAIANGRFSVAWVPREAGHLALRLTISRRGHELAATGTHMLVVLERSEANPDPLDPASTPAHEVTPREAAGSPSGPPERQPRPPKYCLEPSAPTEVPSGDGWIVGGLYFGGGPPPGAYSCQGAPYTISVTDESGTTVATQQVPGGGLSFTFILPPGNYILQSDEGEDSCPDKTHATVIAGQQTKVEVECDEP